MDNQIFLELEPSHEQMLQDEELNILIQAQLNKSLEEIESLLDASSKLSVEQRFTVNQGNNESGMKEKELKTPVVQKLISLFARRAVQIKRSIF